VFGSWIRDKGDELDGWKTNRLNCCIAKDVYEKNDLKAQHPETVKQLLNKLQAWQKTLPAKPEGNVFSAERD